MKARESGMPDQSMWEDFFDPDTVLSKLGLDGTVREVVEVGCGYGTFCVPAAKLVQGQVHGYDIDPAMITASRLRAQAAGVNNLSLHLRDVFEQGTGLPDSSVDYVLLLNILHAENPRILLTEVYRVLAPNGRFGVMHWVSDRPTPRGPSLEIRPSPQTCVKWIEESGFEVRERFIDLPPHHFGIVARKG